MRGPRTYTGEDVVELSVHGNPVITHRIISAALACGARLAEKGEFTKRAFLAGKMDLAQAEAVAQLIAANSSDAAGSALLHLEGALSKEIKNMRRSLIELLARIEAALDYPEEQGEVPLRTVETTLKRTAKQVEALLNTCREGALLKEGLKVVIAGAPNVGKSSLLNRLVGDPRAIVTELPGTTRDAIEEVVTLEGIPLRIIDTAGLRHDPGQIEKLGIERTLAHVDTADLVLFLLDLSRKISKKEQEKIIELRQKNTPLLILGNKADIAIRQALESDLKVSAKTGAGIKKLEKLLIRKAGRTAQKESSSPIITEARHKEKLLEAKEALLRLAEAVKNKAAADFLTIDLKAAIQALGEITGEAVSEEVIQHIFENFCLGK